MRRRAPTGRIASFRFRAPRRRKASCGFASIRILVDRLVPAVVHEHGRRTGLQGVNVVRFEEAAGLQPGGVGGVHEGFPAYLLGGAWKSEIDPAIAGIEEEQEVVVDLGAALRVVLALENTGHLEPEGPDEGAVPSLVGHLASFRGEPGDVL